MTTTKDTIDDHNAAPNGKGAHGGGKNGHHYAYKILSLRHPSEQISLLEFLRKKKDAYKTYHGLQGQKATSKMAWHKREMFATTKCRSTTAPVGGERGLMTAVGR